MGIYIKGVNKPKECKHCRFTYIYEHPEAGDYEICQFIPDEPILPAGIDNRCPLIEVSTPHGRLGDLDELFERLKAWIEHDRHLYKTDTYSFEHLKHILNGVFATPTVIEHEKEINNLELRTKGYEKQMDLFLKKANTMENSLFMQELRRTKDKMEE